MAGNKKGFTLVEVIVVLVILAILAAVMVPAMTGWIDKAKEKRLIVACQACVAAAQTLASEAYGLNGTIAPPEGTAVVDLADVPGSVSSISIDAASVAVDTLTYSEGSESMTYMRQPSPQYVYGTGIEQKLTAASNWAQNYEKTNASKANEFLTIDYGYQSPSPLTEAQMSSIFGDLEPADATQYIYPMAIYDTGGKALNIQYVTPQNPTLTKYQNRYQASAFIIDGKTYVCTLKQNGKVRAVVNATNKDQTTFQKIMNNESFDSTQDFVDFITTDGGYYQLVE